MRVSFEKVLGRLSRADLRAKTDLSSGARRQNGRRLEHLIREKEAAGDRIAIGLGLVLAISSVAFAAHAIQTSSAQSDAPMVAAVAGNRPVNESRTTPLYWQRDLDPTTTGSVREAADSDEGSRGTGSAALKDSSDAKDLSRGYVLRSVIRGAALVEGPDGLREVVPGAVLPGAGRIISIERSGAGWVVVTSTAIIGAAPVQGLGPSPHIVPGA
ncbi:hypothetical protein [Microvirga sp. 2TAF3]|uniref:hypothetical protein n=1 Tax=Microvirga sp. 2TAF3 TaxID=3233014 RepID=UPI003F97C20F